MIPGGTGRYLATILWYWPVAQSTNLWISCLWIPPSESPCGYGRQESSLILGGRAEMNRSHKPLQGVKDVGGGMEDATDIIEGSPQWLTGCTQCLSSQLCKEVKHQHWWTYLAISGKVEAGSGSRQPGSSVGPACSFRSGGYRENGLECTLVLIVTEKTGVAWSTPVFWGPKLDCNKLFKSKIYAYAGLSHPM